MPRDCCETANGNAKYVDELGLLGKGDELVFAIAWKQKRVILTHDLDFLDNSRFPPDRKTGRLQRSRYWVSANGTAMEWVED